MAQRVEDDGSATCPAARPASQRLPRADFGFRQRAIPDFRFLSTRLTPISFMLLLSFPIGGVFAISGLAMFLPQILRPRPGADL